MKPPSFEYVVPETLEDALAVLAKSPYETKLLAGGQSLVPMLNMRLVRPETLLDMNRVKGLNEIRLTNGSLHVGAMVRQHTLETDPLLRRLAPLVGEAAGHVAHLQIRMRGTLGGSLIHADPAAELPTVAKALRATMKLKRADGDTRSVECDEFFLGPLTTAAEPDEILTEVEIVPPPEHTGWAFEEISLTHGAFALVGVAALLHLGADGRVDLARLALCGVDVAPYAPAWLDEMMVGQLPGPELFRQVGARISGSVQPIADRSVGPDYRRAVAGTLTARAFALAQQRAASQPLRQPSA